MWVEVGINVCSEEENRGGGGGGGFQSQIESLDPNFLLLALALSPSLFRCWLRREYRQRGLKLESVFAQKKKKEEEEEEEEEAFSLRIPRPKLSTVGSRSFSVFDQRLVKA